MPRKDALQASILPRNEKQIRNDIINLEAATSQLKQQTIIMRKQNSILKDLQATRKSEQKSVRQNNASQKKRYDREKEQLAVAVII